MKVQITEHDSQVIAAPTAGKTDKTELTNFFGFSPSTIRRVLTGAALAVVTVATIQPARAQLAGDDLNIANQYIAAHPDMRQDQKDAIRGTNDLNQANAFLKGNSYWDQATNSNIKLPPISTADYTISLPATEITPALPTVMASTLTPATPAKNNNVVTEPVDDTLSVPPIVIAPLLTPIVTPAQTVQSTPQAIPQTTPQAIPQAIPQKTPVALAQTTPLTPQAIPQAVPQKTPVALAQTTPLTPQAIPQAVPQKTPVALAQTTPLTPQAIPQAVPQKTPVVLTQTTPLTPQAIPQAVPQKTPVALAQTTPLTPQAIPQAVSQKTPDEPVMQNVLTRAAQVPPLATNQTPVNTVTQATTSPAQQQIRSSYYDHQITDLNSAAEQNQAEILSESHARASGDAQTLQQSQDYTNHKFADLKNQIDDNKDQANAGTASALAAVGIPQVETGSDFMVGAGAGTYGNQSAIAVGVSGHLTAKTVTKLAITGDTNSGFGASAGVGWNF